MTSSFILVSPPGPALDRLGSELEAAGSLEIAPNAGGLVEILDRSASSPTGVMEGSTGGPSENPVWILIGPDLPPEELSALLDIAAQRRGTLRLVEVLEGDDGFLARPLSVGFADPVAELLSRASPAEDRGVVLELHEVLARIARGRHDMNNSLTAAVAEVQLLLMDVEEGSETEEGLQVIQTQLERIRDLVAGLRELRAPPVGE